MNIFLICFFVWLITTVIDTLILVFFFYLKNEKQEEEILTLKKEIKRRDKIKEEFLKLKGIYEEDSLDPIKYGSSLKTEFAIQDLFFKIQKKIIEKGLIKVYPMIFCSSKEQPPKRVKVYTAVLEEFKGGQENEEYND